MKRVVVVSSIGAVMFNRSWPKDQPMDEECWSDTELCKAVQVSHTQRLQLFLKCPELAFFFFLSRLQHATYSAVTLIFTLGNSRIHPLSLGV